MESHLEPAGKSRKGAPVIWEGGRRRALATSHTRTSVRFCELLNRVHAALMLQQTPLSSRRRKAVYSRAMAEISAFLKATEKPGRKDPTSHTYVVTLRNVAWYMTMRFINLGERPKAVDFAPIFATPTDFALSFGGEAKYRFRFDYFSWNIDSWRSVLLPMLGAKRNNILEIGCLEGMSSVWFADNLLSNTRSRLVCVDTFELIGDKEFKRNIQLSGKANQIRVLKGRSQKILPSLPARSFDCIYVDGSHRYEDCLDDAKQSWRLLKPGGVIFFDDYLARFPEYGGPSVGQAVDDFLASLSDRHEIAVSRGGQLILRKSGVDDFLASLSDRLISKRSEEEEWHRRSEGRDHSSITP